MSAAAQAGLVGVGPVVVITGDWLQPALAAVLIATRTRKLNGLAPSASYTALAQVLHDAMAANGVAAPQPSPASGCARRMLGHASAKLTLDTYADLFDDDLVAVTLHARYSPEVTRKCAQIVPTEGFDS